MTHPVVMTAQLRNYVYTHGARITVIYCRNYVNLLNAFGYVLGRSSTRFNVNSSEIVQRSKFGKGGTRGVPIIGERTEIFTHASQ